MITESTKIQDCDLSIHVKKIFRNAKIETIKELLELERNDLIRYRGFGRKSLNELMSFLNTNGFGYDN